MKNNFYIVNLKVLHEIMVNTRNNKTPFNEWKENCSFFYSTVHSYSKVLPQETINACINTLSLAKVIVKDNKEHEEYIEILSELRGFTKSKTM